MLRELELVLKDLELYFFRCPCHPERFQDLFKGIDDELHPTHHLDTWLKKVRCPLNGCSFPNMAVGDWKDALKTFSQMRTSRVVAFTQELPPAGRAKVVSDCASGLRVVAEKLELKFGFLFEFIRQQF